jgi:hypothetical protein
MFKIVASFTRPNSDFEFFNDTYSNYDIIAEIQNNAAKLPGFLGIDENIYRDEFKCDKALCFDSEESFNEFVQYNQLLLYKRNQIIEEYCQRTGQEYKYYIIKD